MLFNFKKLPARSRILQSLCSLGILTMALTLAGALGCAAESESLSTAIGGEPSSAEVQEHAESFLKLYNSLYESMYRIESEAWWAASTDVKPEHEGMRIAAGKANAAFTGDREVIRWLRYFREHADKLDDLTNRQIQKAWLIAAANPGTAPELVGQRIEAEARQASALDGFEFTFDDGRGDGPRGVTPNDIDDALLEERNLEQRLRWWESGKQTGPALRDGLVTLQGLRNDLAREMGYDSFFALQVADYGMEVDEMMSMLEGWIEDIWPLYVELHTWTKYTLAERYGMDDVPEMIPAHWLANRWGQNWPGLVDGIELGNLYADKSPQWIIDQAEAFYTSMGFAELPAVFHEKSDLFPVAEGSSRKKNTHASAWHIDLQNDVRSLMSVTPNQRWFGTTHHELGHIYYYMSYTRPEVPLLLRAGANRGFHEGIGEQINIASSQLPYLRAIGLIDEDTQVDPILWLLNEALSETIAFLPWAAGTISHWERDLYEENLEPAEWNARWWAYKQRFQGIAPPSPRGEEACDPATKTHVNDDPAQYYDYAVATVLKYQLHTHIAQEILKQDPNAANYLGSKETGAFLKGILEKGATGDWEELLVEATGSKLSTKPMMDYFAPLYAWLQEENEGRQKGWN